VVEDDRGGAPAWNDRLQSLIDETVDRSTASTANFGRLLAAATGPGMNPDSWTAELTRQGTEHGPEAYRRLNDVTTRFFSESLRLVARYLDAYLRDLVPSGHIGRVGSPPAMPLAPLSSDTVAWTAWYQRYASWITEQQAWSARLLGVMREEVANGRMRSDAMQSSAREFVQRQLPDYLLDMAQLNTELVSDVLGVADESLERLADALLGDAGFDDLVIDVAGETGSVVVVALAVENSRADPAVISCETRAVNGFALDVTPRQFPLDPAETRPVSIEVGLPSGPAGPPTDAGSVTIRGQDERDLVVRIMARVDEPPESAAQEATLIAESSPPSIRVIVSEDADGSDDSKGPEPEGPDPEGPDPSSASD